jgi:hypothetical protein
METNIRAAHSVHAELQTTAPSDAAVQVNDADAARSRENISQWSAYLPADCAKTMIEMGWDLTT